MQDINPDLIRMLYAKYSPETDVDSKIEYIQQQYGGNQEEFVRNFYAKYEPNVDIDSKLQYISEAYPVKKKDETTELDSLQEEVVTTSDTEEVETPGVSDVSVSDEVVETTQEPSVETPELVEQTTEEEVEVELDPDKLAQQQSQIDQVLAESFKVTSNVTELKKQNEIPLSILDAYGREIMMADNEVAAEGLQKIYNNHGFTFEDTGLGTMNVTAANGKETMIDTDTWTEDGAIEEAQKLKSFLQANKEEYEDITIETIYESTKKDKKEFLKYYDENLVNESIKDMNSRIGRFQDKGLEYEKNVKQFEKDYNLFIDNAKNGLLTPEQIKTQEELFAERATGLESQLSELREDKTHLDDVKFKLNEIMGEHVALEAQKGNWVKSWWKSFVNTFDAKNASLTGGMIDIITSVMGEEGLDSLMPLINEEGEFTGKRKDETNSEYRDRVSKQIKNELKPMIRTSLQDQITGGVTNEYQEQFQKTTWGMVSTAMAEMGAHMLASGGRSDVMAISFGLQINDAVFKEMESIEEFKNVSEAEKAGVAGLVSLTSGILESLGVSKILNKTGVSKSILFRALGKLGPKASYKSLENLIELEVKNILVKGGVKVIGSGLIEAETEVLQDISERSIKDIYNTLKEKEFFSKESTEITLANSLQSAKIGFLAGFGIGGVTASVQAYKQNGIDKLNIEQFEIAKSLVTNPKTRQIYTDKIKIELADGTTTKSKAENEIKRMNEMVSIFNQIPKDIDVAGQQEAFALLQEKAALQKQIAGKNESLTKKERTRISDIDTRLERISETKTTTEEVVAEQVVTEEVVEETPTTEVTEEVEVTPEVLSEGKQEVTDVTEGIMTTTKPVKIFKGIGGKKDLQGFRINAHEGAEGVFSSVDESVAEEYGREEGVAEVILPEGTTVEVVEIDGKGMTLPEYRAAEVEAINNSDAQVVKLVTVDGVLKKGQKKQQQYVIKDESLIEELTTPTTEVKEEIVEDTPTEEVVTEEVVEETPVAEEVVEEKQSKERVDNIVDEIITKVEGRNFGEDTNPEVILESVQGYLQGSKFYEEATDIERESAVREINEKLEIKIPKAPSVKKILRKPKKKKVVVDEMAALKDQIKLEARSARGAVRDVNTKRKELANQVKELVKTGKITSNQARVIINKISSVNLYNPKSVDAFIKYIDKVYKKAELADKISKSKKLLRQAKKNLKNKIGASPDLQSILDELFAIDPSIIPLNKFDSYFKLLESFGQRKKVLSLPEAGEVMETASDIINSVDIEVNEEVNESLPAKLNEEIEADLDGYLDNIISNKASLENTYDERGKDLGKYLNQLSKDDLLGLVKEKKDGTKDYSNLENLKVIKENISNGYIPKFAMDLKISVESNKSSKNIENIVSAVKEKNILTGFSRVYGKLKSLFSDKSKMQESLRGTPTFYWDDILGNFNSKTIWNNTLGKLATSYSKFQSNFAKNVSSKIEAAESLLYKTKIPTIQKSNNKVQKSKYKIMTYRLQREFESNPNNKQVAPAIDFINKTIESIERLESSERLNQRDIKLLEEIKNEFSVDGEINMEKIEDSFTQNEKKALKLLDEINVFLEPKAVFTSSVLRGEKIKPINNYVHHSVTQKEQPEDLFNKTNKLVNPSTKAGTLRERTPGAKAINFDPISSTLSGARETLLDFYMTETIKTVNSSLRKAKDKIFENPKSKKISKESISALEKSVEEVLRKTFADSFVQYDVASTVIKKLQKLGYQAALASVPRAAAELGTNLLYGTISNPQGLSQGISKYGSFVMGSEGLNAMENLGSSETMKLYDTKNLTGKMADSNILYTGVPKSSKTLSNVVDKAQYLSQFTGVRQLKDFAGKISDTLISSPDKAISRPLWFGNFSKKFKELTGVDLNSKDFEEIGEGKSKYLTDKYKSEIKESTNYADEQSVKMATSTNPFNVIPKNIPTPNESTISQLYKIANSYMARFSQYEYATARNAIVSLFKAGEISKTQALATIIAVQMRMASYMVLYSLFNSAFDALFGIDEEEEDLGSIIKRQLVGAPLSLLTGRGLGNVPKVFINYGLEKFNSEYLEDLRNNKKYDPYKHSIVFSQVTDEMLSTKSPEEIFLYLVAGPLSPLSRTLSRLIKVTSKSQTAAQKETRAKYQKELEERMVLEGLGNLGFIPFYKDIRRMYLKDMFKDKKSTKLQELLGEPKKTTVIKDAELEEVGELEEVELKEVKYED